LQTMDGVKIDIGANPSAEGGEEESANDGQSAVVNDVIDTFHLQETVFDKKSYLAYIKGYLKKLKEMNSYDSSAEEAFKKRAGDFVSDVIANFGEYQFYTGESMDPEAMTVLMKYEENASAPCAFYLKDGLRSEKV
ncbi:unnamed protein product, partial [Sphagnum compactum]